jgi:hypothetical protein
VGTAPAPVSAPFSASDQPALEQAVLAALQSTPAVATPPSPTPPTTGGTAQCPTTPDGQWHVARFGGCLVGSLTFKNSLLDGLLAGGFSLRLTDELTLSPTGRTWSEWVTLELQGVTGNVPPYIMTVTPTCGAGCTAGQSVTVALTPDQPTSFEVDGTDSGSTSTDWLSINWSAQLVPQLPTVTLPFTPASDVSSFQWNSADLRCDSIAAAAPGCVFPQAIVTYNRLSLGSTTLGDVAEDVVAAQAKLGSGLLGVGAPLAFTSDSQLLAANVDSTCESARLQSTRGDACDQYPFTSTYQGASQTPDSVSVPTDVVEVAQATTLLNVWYASQRMIDGDQFWVTVRR